MTNTPRKIVFDKLEMLNKHFKTPAAPRLP